MRKVAQQCLMGEKVICLCISEPYAGSDVANIRCTAQKKRVLNKKTGVEEEVYVVNGEKKWITNGTYADYFIVAARTGPKGNKGISLLLVDITSSSFFLLLCHVIILFRFWFLLHRFEHTEEEEGGGRLYNLKR